MENIKRFQEPKDDVYTNECCYCLAAAAVLHLPARPRIPSHQPGPAGTAIYAKAIELNLTRAIPYLHDLHQALESINKPHRLRVRKEIVTDDLPYSTAIDYERLYTILSLLCT
jgi:hypothetical protein